MLSIGRVCAVAGICMALATQPSSAESVSVGALKDNTLYEHPSGFTSNGAGQQMFAGVTVANEIRRALVAFDVASSVPAGSMITGVTLKLHMSRSISGVQSVALHRLLADWGEGASDASGQEGGGTGAAAGDATWIHTFYDSAFWSTPGGDYSNVASAVTSVGGVGFYTWSSPAMIADVQTWLNNPASNFGWAILGDETDLPSAKRFSTKESFNAANRPELLIEYAIPAPGTAALAMCGIAGYAGRRRR